MRPSVPNKSGARFIGIVFFLLAVFMITLSVHIYMNARIPGSYVKTTGTVVSNQSYVSVSRFGTEKLYFPVISFKARNDQTYTVSGNISQANSPAYKPGAHLQVAYNPASPAVKSKMVSTAGQSWAAILLFVLGIFFLALSILGIKIGFFRKPPKTTA